MLDLCQYETASRRFYNGKNIPVLLCLSRSWYGKANKDQKYNAMQTALKYAQSVRLFVFHFFKEPPFIATPQALHLQPNDKAVLYNIAMIQQKAAELLFSISLSKRSLEELKHAIDQAGNAQKYILWLCQVYTTDLPASFRLFACLAADISYPLPYSREMADQRRKYGESMLRKAADHLATQEEWESQVRDRLDAARQKRQEEKERVSALEASVLNVLYNILTSLTCP
jgi:RNA polymerase-associated protein CTR9